MTKTIHFIGIGGIGMSGIARFYLAMGHRVQGSDLKKNEVLAELERMGAKVFIGHEPAQVSGADWVVYSSAIPENHPERMAAVKNGQTLMHRADALADICRGKTVIAVTGTHGKTTTTALIASVLKEARRDPSVVVGGLVKAFGGNAHVGQGPEIVIEADESDSSFLKLSPSLEVITNIEEEHLDHFKNAAAIEDAYRRFIERLPPSEGGSASGGKKAAWFGCAEDPRVAALAQGVSREATLYGFSPSPKNIHAGDIVECPHGRRGISFTAWKGRRLLGQVRLRLMGRHNVLNALAAIAVGLKLGISFEIIREGLARYEGAARRFDVKYENDDFLVVDDYAHHPTEIRQTLAAARALGRKRILAVFQPHRFTRTAAFLKDFAASFGDADQLFVTDVYSAGEAPLDGVTGEKLCRETQAHGHRSATFVPRGEVSSAVQRAVRSGDLVIALGAGDICRVADELSGYLTRRKTAHSLQGGFRGRVSLDEPLSKHTTLRVGGPADYWVEPEDEEDLKAAIQWADRKGLPIYLFGAGSNILAPDEGLRGMAIHLISPYFRWIGKNADGRLVARAGAPSALFIQYALEQGFGECEFLSGIPGEMGGLVAMNAGSHGQSIGAFLHSVKIVDGEGRSRVLSHAEIPFRYRSSGIDGIITEATFSFPKCDFEKTQARLEEYRAYRQKTQDLQRPSAGCMFKNPENASAGKWIEEAGLKGSRIGNAQVSTKHANFIINLGGATAADIEQLIRHVQTTVEQKFGIKLETEVKILARDAGIAGILARSHAHKREPRDRRVAQEMIAVLCGGTSCEREVSLVSGKAVYEALKSKGFDVMLIDASEDFISLLKNANVETVFLALHGAFGEDGTVQRLLEKEGLSYTGSGPGASELAFDKAAAQAVLQAAGVSVPEFVVVRKGDPLPVTVALPCVVKPAKAGSSMGISIVKDASRFTEACSEAFRFSDAILVERYIQGRELTVGILDGQPLPIVEVIAARAWYDYQAKYGDSGTRYEFPARLDERDTAEVLRQALAAYRALGCEVMARVDVMLGDDGRPYVLEANTIPGLTGKSLLPKAAQAAGIDFPSLCVKILELSKNRVKEFSAWSAH